MKKITSPACLSEFMKHNRYLRQLQSCRKEENLAFMFFICRQQEGRKFLSLGEDFHRTPPRETCLASCVVCSGSSSTRIFLVILSKTMVPSQQAHSKQHPGTHEKLKKKKQPRTKRNSPCDVELAPLSPMTRWSSVHFL